MDYTNNYLEQDIKSGKGMGVLSYLGWFLLIPLFVNSRRKNPYVRFHLNQGILLLLISIITNIIGEIACWVLELILLGFIAGIVGVVVDIIQVLIFVFMILGIIDVINGRARELPLIGGIRILK